MDLEKEFSMLNQIYNMREEDLALENKQDKLELKEKLHVVKLEEIEKRINELNENNMDEKKEIIKEIEKLVENYEIQISYYSEKNYKYGFKDAFLLYNECLKKN